MESVGVEVEVEVGVGELDIIQLVITNGLKLIKPARNRTPPLCNTFHQKQLPLPNPSHKSNPPNEKDPEKWALGLNDVGLAGVRVRHVEGKCDCAREWVVGGLWAGLGWKRKIGDGVVGIWRGWAVGSGWWGLAFFWGWGC